MKLPKRLSIVLVSAAFAVVVGCGDHFTDSSLGFVSVSIIDTSTLLPVPNVVVAISGTGHSATTGKDGSVRFELTPGKYYVDSNVCCVGPSFKRYHLPIIVESGREIEVSLAACSACL